MQITVKLYASFRNGRFKIDRQEFVSGADCRTVILCLGMIEEEVGVILVNGRHATLDQVLQDLDILALFPLIGGG